MRDGYPSDRNNKGRSTVYSFLKPEGGVHLHTAIRLFNRNSLKALKTDQSSDQETLCRVYKTTREVGLPLKT
jgi:hypothetical protein